MGTSIRVALRIPAKHPRNVAGVALDTAYFFNGTGQAAADFMDALVADGCIITQWESVKVYESADEAKLHLWSRVRR